MLQGNERMTSVQEWNKIIYYCYVECFNFFVFLQLRGYPNKECRQHAATVLTQLKLWNVRTSLPGNLTKDELRRLGLAMAFADAPKIILLDEPTRGKLFS